MNILNLPTKLQPLKEHLKALTNCCTEFNISIGALALNFAIESPHIDKVVIGVDRASQLKSNIEQVESWKSNPSLIQKVKEINVVEKELLNPANW